MNNFSTLNTKLNNGTYMPMLGLGVYDRYESQAFKAVLKPHMDKVFVVDYFVEPNK